jgi:tetratricopeptide (TPR) repeat protein
LRTISATLLIVTLSVSIVFNSRASLLSLITGQKSSNDSNNIVAIAPTTDPSKNNIYKFLLADLALYRQQTELAKQHFEQLLLNTKDPDLAELVTELAIETEDYQLSTLAAKQWAELAPNNLTAQLVAIAIFLGDDIQLVEKFIQQAIVADPEKIDNQLSSLLPKLSSANQQALQEILVSIVNKDPNNYVKQICLAQIAAQLSDIKLAKQAVTAALNLKTDFTKAILLQAKLIRYHSNSDDSALKYLKQQIHLLPNDEELKLFYINALLDNNQYAPALNLINKILNSNNLNNKLEAHLLSAEIYLQPSNLNLNQAKKHLTILANNNFSINKVYFMLGQIAEQQENYQEAIKLYSLVEEEPYHLISVLRAALLLTNAQQLYKAIDLLNTAQPSTVLEKKQLLLFKIELALELKDFQLAQTIANDGLDMIPNDIDFLYSRSITSSLDNKLSVAEQDLKQIINLQPDNHNALNALGFILTINSERQQEAFNYLKQALALSPQNPLYMDNMGLLLYRMGEISDSLEILAKAYKLSDNLNIAIHFGEVLWAAGKKQQATAIWKKAWKDNPEDTELINTLNQHQVIFSP